MPNRQSKTNSLPSLIDIAEQSILTPNYPKRARFGVCPLCHREVDLTFHHLIPKKMHRRTFFKKNYSKQALAEGVDICRKCHTGIHKTYDEMQLAKRFNTLKDLQSDPPLAAHFAWVSKQKVTS